jgi:hypothetical protein
MHRANNDEEEQARGDGAYFLYVRNPSGVLTKSVCKMQINLGMHRANNDEEEQARGDGAYFLYVRNPSGVLTKSVFALCIPKKRKWKQGQ